MTDIFNDYKWTGYTEPQKGISGKKIIKTLVANEENLKKFDQVSQQKSFLIDKSSRALWKFSSDKKTIEPIYDNQVLTEEDLKEEK